MANTATTEIGTPRTSAQGMVMVSAVPAYITGPYNAFPRQRELVGEYALMAEYEPTVRRVLALLRTLVVSRLGEYQHPDAQVQERVRALLRRLRGGVPRLFSSLLSAMWAGFAVAEPVWETSGSEWWVRQVDLLHPCSFFGDGSGDSGGDAETRGHGIRLDKTTGQVEELTQYPAKPGEKSVTHKRSDVIYWPLFAELREHVYGASLLKAARRAWYSKTILENSWNTFGEKTAMPTPVFSCPNTTVWDADTGREMSISEFLIRQWERVIPGAAIALPGDKEAAAGFGTIVPTGDGSAFEKLTGYWKNELFNSMITPRIILEEPEHASRAQTGSVLDLFFMLVDGMRREEGRIIIDELVKPLVIHNLGEQEEYGDWTWGRLQPKDLEVLGRVFESVQRGRQAAALSGLPTTDADDTKLRSVFDEILAPPGSEDGPTSHDSAAGAPAPSSVDRYAQ